MTMKFINLVLFIMVFSSFDQCDQPQEVVKVVYEAYTRGSNYTVEINKDLIVVHSGLRGAEVSQRKVTPAEWENLQEQVSEIALEDLEEMRPDSEKRFSDAAAHARVKIHAGQSVFESPEFDDGNPPQPLQSLVKAMITLAETVE